jgi:hypothetical protein
VPRQQRVRRDDRGELPQQPSPQRPSLRGEPTALIVGEPQPPGAGLFAQDAVLFQEIVDDVALLLVDPAGERDQHELQWMRRRRHGDQRIRSWDHRSSGRVVEVSIEFLDRRGHATVPIRPAQYEKHVSYF